MATSETFLVLTLVSFLVPTGAAAETCKSSKCPTIDRYPYTTFNPTIRFPFRLETDNQSGRCGYPGFGLSCDSNNQTILSMAELAVTAIDYPNQTLEAKDPENCMPGRYLADRFVDFPFQLDPRSGFRNFTFVNCTGNRTDLPYYVELFPCLSGPNDTVGAYLSYDEYNTSLFGCRVIKTVLVQQSLYSDVSLSWNQPECGRCLGSCGFKSRSGLEVACFDVPGNHKGLSRRAKYGIIIAGVLVFLLLSGLVFYFSGRVASNRGNEQQANPDALVAQPVPNDVVTVGLARSVIDSYPKHE